MKTDSKLFSWIYLSRLVKIICLFWNRVRSILHWRSGLGPSQFMSLHLMPGFDLFPVSNVSDISKISSQLFLKYFVSIELVAVQITLGCWWCAQHVMTPLRRCAWFSTSNIYYISYIARRIAFRFKAKDFIDRLRLFRIFVIINWAPRNNNFGVPTLSISSKKKGYAFVR